MLAVANPNLTSVLSLWLVHCQTPHSRKALAKHLQSLGTN